MVSSSSTDLKKDGYAFWKVDVFWIEVIFFIFSVFLFAVCMYACLFVRWVYKRRLNQKIEDMINRYYKDEENRKQAQIDMKKDELGGDERGNCICRNNLHICQIPRVITDVQTIENETKQKREMKEKEPVKEPVRFVRINELPEEPIKKKEKDVSKKNVSFQEKVKSYQSDPDLIKTMPVLIQPVREVGCQTIDDSLYPPPAPIVAPMYANPTPKQSASQRNNSNDLFEDYGSMNYYENNGKVNGIMNASKMNSPLPMRSKTKIKMDDPKNTGTTSSNTSQTPTTQTTSNISTNDSSSTTKQQSTTNISNENENLKKNKSNTKPPANESESSDSDNQKQSGNDNKEVNSDYLPSAGEKNSTAIKNQNDKNKKESEYFPSAAEKTPENAKNNRPEDTDSPTRLFPYFNKNNPKNTRSKTSTPTDSKATVNSEYF
ncbi:unnamed protein product [Caenorhabditis angaria]|uniref:Uncharacterized protein n=1 Tax=Caenorhabditis angaria TaxID=860376 RepID=A0A9P1I6C4_9PELO|nr:unnamed protein product [Caenorhabditis angaria]